MTLRIMLQKAHQRNVLPRHGSENGAGTSREIASNHFQGPVPHQHPQPSTHQYRSPSDQGHQLTSPSVPPGGAPMQLQQIYPSEMLPQQFAQMIPHYELDPNGEVPGKLCLLTLVQTRLMRCSCSLAF